MKIKKISSIDNREDAIMYMFNACRGDVLRQLIPAEYKDLLVQYEEIKAQRSKPRDLEGQQTLWEEIAHLNPF